MSPIYKVRIEDIVIPEAFKEHQPKEYRLERVRKYVEEHGNIDELPVTLNTNNVLTDGYARYLVAKENDLGIIPYVLAQEHPEKPKNPKLLSIIEARFDGCPKKYYWKNPKGLLIRVGDRIKVMTKTSNGLFDKIAEVKVTRVFLSDKPHHAAHKDVVEVCGK